MAKALWIKGIAGSLAMAFVLLGAIQAEAGSVRGYFKRDGRYVQPHFRSNPDRSYNNNWSRRGNLNPFNGRRGNKSPTLNDRTPRSNIRRFGIPLTIR